ncbi:type II secretion system F family protein [Agromyces sp. NPDC004153]
MTAATSLRSRVATRLRRRQRDPAAELDAVAAIAERLAVLLSAGVPASVAWSHVDVGPTDAGVAGDDDDVAVLRAAAAAAAGGASVPAAIASARAGASRTSTRWAILGAAWEVAVESGAPLASGLRELAGALRDEAQLRREVGTALAGPVSSARLVLALPLIAVVFGAAFGFDTVGVLFGNPLGVACVGGGVLLLWAGRRWSRSLVARATSSEAERGLELELVAMALSGGAAVERARAIVREALASVGGTAASVADDIDGVIAVAARAGAPVADLLRAEAARRRRSARADGAARAAALGVRLMLPLGVCVLPAFVLLGVVPLIVSVVTGTLGGAA